MVAESAPLVSVIVPTSNAAADLSRLLASLDNQTHGNTETIVVDNLSRDGTVHVALLHRAAALTIKSGRSEARNRGAEAAHGEYVFFVDADMILDPTVIADCVAAAQAGAEAVIVPEKSIGRGFLAKCKGLEKECYIGDDDIEAARLFSVPLFRKLGGYDATLTAGEDWDISQRARNLGARIARISSVIHHNDGRVDLGSDLRKKLFYGKSLARYGMKHPVQFKRQRRFLRPAFLRNTRLLLKHPLLAGGMFSLKACEFIAFGIGVVAAR